MPSKKVLEQKQAIVSELTGILNDAPSGVLVSYNGITVVDDTRLRALLRKEGVHYRVIKNKLLKFAVKDADLGAMADWLAGDTALAVNTTDTLAAARILCTFAEKNPNIVVKGGFMDGKVLSAEEIGKLAKLPSKEVLLTQVVYGINFPITSLAVALNAVVEKMQGETEPAA